MSRHVPLAGVRNFRDFGDYPAGARRMRKGVLYRSAHHAKATDEDLLALAALSPAIIVDLRRNAERANEPSRRWPDFSSHLIENDDHDETQEAHEADWLAFVAQLGLTQEAILERGHAWYRRAPFEPRHIDLFSRFFHALAETPGPVLIHCAGGKDRTGILAALTHHIAGVADEDIISDYLLTNDPATYARAEIEIMTWMMREAPHNADPALIRTIYEITPAHLQCAFDEMKARYGSIDDYLARALGVDVALRAKIEARILE